VDHEAKKTHLGGTALVELDGTLLELGLFIKGVPAKVDGTVAEVTREFGSATVVTHDEFQRQDEGKDLTDSLLGDGSQCGSARGDIAERKTRVVDIAWQTDTSVRSKEASDGKHGDSAVLQLNKTKALETFFASVVEHSQRIEESKWRLDTEFVLISHLHGRGLGGLLGRGKGGSTGNKGSKDSSLHLGCFFDRSEKMRSTRAGIWFYVKPGRWLRRKIRQRYPLPNVLSDIEQSLLTQFETNDGVNKDRGSRRATASVEPMP
jgi:hypothetical protein